MLTFPHLRLNRRQWKEAYRLYRICMREAAKANLDMMLYGSGYIQITNEPDYIKHIPIQAIQIKSAPKVS